MSNRLALHPIGALPQSFNINTSTTRHVQFPEDAIGNVAGAVDGAVTGTEKAAETVVHKVVDMVSGPTAESQYNNAEVFAPKASSTQPVSKGNRSKAPDGSDPYRAVASEPDAKAKA
ncbi:hypothetical protein BGW80DRAFT_1557356 [Lactifluus volemus]|nr:hypothetical protein BGW80DRAFT_1557356 [Lactifluus volemus]